MELRELLSHLGRRLWLLVILPLAALLVVIGLNAPNGTKYSSTVDLRVVNPNGDQTVAAINLVAGSLVNAATSDDVVRELASQGGATEDRIRNGLSAARIADTELVRVTFADPDEGVVNKVIAQVPTAIQNQIFAPASRQAERAETEAQNQLTAALDDLDKVRATTGLNDPDREFQTAADAVTQFQVALATAKGRGDNTRYLDSALATAQEHLADIVKNEPAFVGPQYAVDNARQDLADRATAMADIKARQAATIAESVGTKSAPLAWYTTILRKALTAVLIGLAVAVLLLAIPEVLRRSRRESEDEIYEPDAAEIAWEQQGVIAPRGPRSPGLAHGPIHDPFATSVEPTRSTLPRSQVGGGEVSLSKPGE
ncbi:MAG: hypothetical protein IPH03_04885 [Tetrasphaera sp.]|nr:hypothetical protein [Tetrasphaera sp.]